MASIFTPDTPAAPPRPKKQTKWESRAALRLIEPGSMVDCNHCGDRVKFQARVRMYQVICNVYIGNVWDRVEHYHEECYRQADNPHGEPAA
jgi:hypothetical protein